MTEMTPAEIIAKIEDIEEQVTRLLEASRAKTNLLEHILEHLFALKPLSGMQLLAWQKRFLDIQEEEFKGVNDDTNRT